uniref:Uncharacterized protein n=1 Tax=Panagrolaimus sp. JU765 TaxID=591449 RepID=A0AC34Q9V4_9BILA
MVLAVCSSLILMEFSVKLPSMIFQLDAALMKLFVLSKLSNLLTSMAKFAQPTGILERTQSNPMSRLAKNSSTNNKIGLFEPF